MRHPALLDRADTVFLLIDLQASYRTVLSGWDRVVAATAVSVKWWKISEGIIQHG